MIRLDILNRDIQKLTACLSSLWRIRLVRIVVMVYLVTFLVILPICLFHVRYSMYFLRGDSAVEQERLIARNKFRVEEAERYFNTVNPNSLPISHGRDLAGKHPADIVISIITTNRKRPSDKTFQAKYLTQVAWRVLTLLEEAKNAGFLYDVHLSICNVDRNVVSYQEAKYLETFIPVFKRFRSVHFSMVHALEKEKQDYVFCLNNSMNAFNNVSYVLLVEDDAYPRDDLFPVLQYTINRHLKQQWNQGEMETRNLTNVAYIKFYHPNWLLGFNSFGVRRITDLIAFSLLLSTVILLVHKWWNRESNHRIIFIWISSFIYCLLVIFMIGRVNLNSLRRYFAPYLHIFVPAPSCCTPAMMFPAASAQRVISFMESVHCSNNYGKDTVLDDLIRLKGMLAYMVEPNTFDHIGLYSTLREQFVSPFVID